MAMALFFRTEDGEAHFENLQIPMMEFENAGFSYVPFVQPKNIEQNGDLLVMTVGQGENGDFKGGEYMCLAQFISNDLGITWRFEKLIEGNVTNELG